VTKSRYTDSRNIVVSDELDPSQKRRRLLLKGLAGAGITAGTLGVAEVIGPDLVHKAGEFYEESHYAAHFNLAQEVAQGKFNKIASTQYAGGHANTLYKNLKHDIAHKSGKQLKEDLKHILEEDSQSRLAVAKALAYTLSAPQLELEDRKDMLRVLLDNTGFARKAHYLTSEQPQGETRRLPEKTLWELARDGYSFTSPKGGAQVIIPPSAELGDWLENYAKIMPSAQSQARGAER
jgi:hypothetical protein